MRRLCLILALLAVSLLASPRARAAVGEVQIHLLVMGPGEHLYTRGGHAALLVLELEDGAPARTTVYNYGDTNWDDPMLVPNFLRGELVFFLSNTGELLPTIEEYGVEQGRTVTRQRLNVTHEQAAEIKRRLEESALPGKREYTFHHRHALCSTRIMDLLDDVLGGRLRAELAPVPGPHTGRHYQELIFSASPLASVAGDLFLGRLHDRVMNRYESAASPALMSEYLQTILVPAPSGDGTLVPLADAPVPLVERTEPLVVAKSWFSHVLWGALIALLLGFGARAYLRAGARPKRCAQLVFRMALASGLVGLVIAAFIALSSVPEFRQNELILLFWPTDLWLAWRARAFAARRAPIDSRVRNYMSARLAVAGLVVVGHVAGVLYQEPRIVAALGCVAVTVMWALVRALSAKRAAVADSAVATAVRA